MGHLYHPIRWGRGYHTKVDNKNEAFICLLKQTVDLKLLNDIPDTIPDLKQVVIPAAAVAPSPIVEAGRPTPAPVVASSPGLEAWRPTPAPTAAAGEPASSPLVGAGRPTPAGRLSLSQNTKRTKKLYRADGSLGAKFRTDCCLTPPSGTPLRLPVNRLLAQPPFRRGIFFSKIGSTEI